MSPGHGSGRRTGTETETPEAIIEVKELEKEFTVDGGSIEVIRSLSFSVLDGEILTVVGPSGCGKTTLLRLLGGFTRASRGEIRYRGQLLPAPDPSRVMMFQEFDQLFPWKSVASNVEFPMAAGKGRFSYGDEERRRRRAAILEEVGLRGYEGYYPHQLSGGMKQRTALARTLAGDPGLVLMDEPFGSVDAQKREELQELLLSIRNRRRFTTVFVTHDIQEAVYLADRVLVMGKTGSPIQEIVSVDIKRPRSREDERLEELRRRIRGLIASV